MRRTRKKQAQCWENRVRKGELCCHKSVAAVVINSFDWHMMAVANRLSYV